MEAGLLGEVGLAEEILVEVGLAALGDLKDDLGGGEAAHDRLCEDLLWPHERAAILSFAAGATMGAGAIAILARSHRAQRERSHAAIATDVTGS